MRKTSLNELQKAIYEAFSGEYNIYDSTPPKPIYPYMIIGRDNTIDRGTKTTFAEEVNVQLSFFSLYQGYKEVKDLADEIIAKLYDATLDMANYSIYSRKLILADSLSGVNPDGSEYKQMVIKYRFLIEEKGGD